MILYFLKFLQACFMLCSEFILTLKKINHLNHGTNESTANNGTHHPAPSNLCYFVILVFASYPFLQPWGLNSGLLHAKRMSCCSATAAPASDSFARTEHCRCSSFPLGAVILPQVHSHSVDPLFVPPRAFIISVHHVSLAIVSLRQLVSLQPAICIRS